MYRERRAHRAQEARRAFKVLLVNKAFRANRAKPAPQALSERPAPLVQPGLKAIKVKKATHLPMRTLPQNSLPH